MLATFAALFGIGYDALRSPEISMDSMIDPSRPFTFPFFVQNESWLFDMRGTGLICTIDKIELSDGSRMTNAGFRVNRDLTLKPSERGLFGCSFALNLANTRVTAGRIFVSAEYRTLWLIPRQSPEVEFNWVPTGTMPHWVQGKS